jgi:hypothetical protein
MCGSCFQLTGLALAVYSEYAAAGYVWWISCSQNSISRALHPTFRNQTNHDVAFPHPCYIVDCIRPVTGWRRTSNKIAYQETADHGTNQETDVQGSNDEASDQGTNEKASDQGSNDEASAQASNDEAVAQGTNEEASARAQGTNEEASCKAANQETSEQALVIAVAENESIHVADLVN